MADDDLTHADISQERGGVSFSNPGGIPFTDLPEFRRADHPVISGDPADDDAQYLDELLDEANRATALPLPALDARSAESDLKLSDLPPVTEIVHNVLTMAPTDPPQLFLPADPYRCELFVTTDVADRVIIASSKADAQRQTQQQSYNTAQGAFYSVAHTGPVWIGASKFSASREVSVHAVTAAPKAGA